MRFSQVKECESKFLCILLNISQIKKCFRLSFVDGTGINCNYQFDVSLPVHHELAIY